MYSSTPDALSHLISIDLALERGALLHSYFVVYYIQANAHGASAVCLSSLWRHAVEDQHMNCSIAASKEQLEKLERRTLAAMTQRTTTTAQRCHTSRVESSQSVGRSIAPAVDQPSGTRVRACVRASKDSSSTAYLKLNLASCVMRPCIHLFIRDS